MPLFFNVIESTRLEAREQIDGRIAVRELHKANGGEKSERVYIANAEADLDAELEQNARLYLERLARKNG